MFIITQNITEVVIVIDSIKKLLLKFMNDKDIYVKIQIIYIKAK